MALHPPVEVALAQRVDRLPPGPMWSVEPKLDGWRVLLFRFEDRVEIQARSGRLITDRLPDLAEAALQLPAGAVLDGEAVAYQDGRVSLSAMQSRALASPRRAAVLATQSPATFAAFDLLQAPEGEKDLRPRPYTERRAALGEVLAGVGPPIQMVPATQDPEVARDWWEAESTVEGLILKRPGSAYVGGKRYWLKIKR